jgi:major vault protein
VFQPIELNEIQGIQIKVISDYEENGKSYREGEELFIRGSEMPIYFPRPEHSMVSYDGKHKHFATAIPAGEARYVLERTTGNVKTVAGPTMLLPDPRTEVIVRRVLTDKQCQLWYPGNLEAQKYNSALRSLERGVSSTRGAVSEGEVTRSRKIRSNPNALQSVGLADKSSVHSDTLAIGAEEFERSASYTEPRTLTLDTKFSGVPAIDIWTGYAVMVVDKKGNRRVEMGPKTVLLGYDETLEVLSMSTGKPKSTDSLFQTVYLRVKNNQISDIVNAETKDHVNVSFKISLRGDFTGESPKWFDAENYVKLVSDHVRSVAKASIRKLTIEELYANPSGYFRDTVLGEKGPEGRRGMTFAENGFVLNDVEVLEFKVGDAIIAKMLDNTQHQVVESNIGLALAERKLQIDKRQEELVRERVAVKHETERLHSTLNAELEKFNTELAFEKVKRELALSQERKAANLQELEKEKVVQALRDAAMDEKQSAERARLKASADLEHGINAMMQQLALAKTEAETKAVVDRFQAAAGTFAESLIALGSQETMVKVANAMSIQTHIGGPNLVSALQSIFDGTPMQSMVSEILKKTKIDSAALAEKRN